MDYRNGKWRFVFFAFSFRDEMRYRIHTRKEMKLSTLDLIKCYLASGSHFVVNYLEIGLNVAGRNIDRDHELFRSPPVAPV